MIHHFVNAFICTAILALSSISRAEELSPAPVSREETENQIDKPEEPPFLYKVGVNGFLRPEAAGNFHLVDNSYTPGHGEGRFVYRIKPYAFLNPTDWLDLHVEGQGYGYIGGQHQEFSRYS